MAERNYDSLPTAFLRQIFPATTKTIATSQTTLTPLALIMCGWAAMALGLLTVLAFQYWRYSRVVLSRFSSSSKTVQKIFLEQIKRLNIRQDVRFGLSSVVKTPAVFGFFRPIILLPEGWERNLSPTKLSNVIAHELAHIKRRDMQVGWLAALFSCLYWFHPVVWLANLNLRREREMACDDAVLVSSNQEGSRYASTILRVAESFDGRVPAGAGFLGLLELSDNLLSRIRSVADTKRSRRLGRLSGIWILLTMLILVPMGIRAGQLPAKEIINVGSGEAIDISDAHAVWNKVLEVNRIWLDPHPERLHYTLYMVNPPPGNEKQRINLVWLEGDDKLRWEMKGLSAGEQLPDYQLICSGNKEVYLQPDSLKSKGVYRVGDVGSFRQGITCFTGIHALALCGLPEEARIAKISETASGKIIVLEAGFSKTTRGDFGLGLRHSWFGHSTYRLSRVRLHIRVPEFTPVLEEDFRDNDKKICEIDIGPEFIPFGRERAPKIIRYNNKDPGVGLENWILEAHFQKVDNLWLLKEALNLHDGKMVNRIYTADVSTEPIDPALFEIPGSVIDEDEAKAQTTDFEPGDFASNQTPNIASTFPEVGATDVDPEIKEIRVTFDQDMQAGYSWTGGGPDYPETTDKPHWTNRRTCVLLVKLKPAKFYRVGINCGDYDSFRNLGNIPTASSVIYFVTKGAGPEEINAMNIPKMVSMIPENGATNVSSDLKQLSVTFDQVMGEGYSWCGGGGNYPETTGRPQWSSAGKTCTLPVKLKPRWYYRLGLNSSRYNTFETPRGIPLKPVEWEFYTGN